MPDYKVNIRAELENFEKIEKIQSQLQSLEKNPINVKVQLSGLDGSDLSKFTKQLENIGQKLGTSVSNGIKSGISGTKVSSNLSQKVQSLFDTKTIDARLSSFNSTLNKFSPDTESYKQAARSLESLRNAYNELKAAKEAFDKDSSSDTNSKNLIQSYERVQNALKQTQSEMRILSNEQSRLISSSTKASMIKNFESYFDQNSKAAKKYADDISILRQQLESLATTADKVDFDTKFNNLKATINRNGDTGKSAWDELKRDFGQIAEFTGVYGVTSRIQDALMSMPALVVEIDSAMTELRKVSDASENELSAYFEEAAASAQKFGASISDVIHSTADWTLLGYNLDDAKILSDLTTLYQRVGDNMTQESASEAMVSTLQGFQLDVDQAEHIVDAFNEVGNKFAIGSDGIGEALQRSASSMSAAGNTLEETIGLVTAANEVVQDPDRVGNAFKTISMRIRGAKTEMEELGLDTEGMVTSVATLREEVMALSGVDIMQDENTFKSTYDILDELATKWQDLTDIQQAKSCLYVQKCA